jgi:hypothetical protein
MLQLQELKVDNQLCAKMMKQFIEKMGIMLNNLTTLVIKMT